MKNWNDLRRDVLDRVSLEYLLIKALVYDILTDMKIYKIRSEEIKRRAKELEKYMEYIPYQRKNGIA